MRLTFLQKRSTEKIMNKNRFAFLLLLFLSNPAFAQTFDYLFPRNNSSLVSLSTDVILRSSEYLNPSSLSPSEFSVIGAKSGVHSGSVKLSDDNQTVLFLPSVPFSANENVTVSVSSGIRAVNGDSLPAVTFSFRTTPLKGPMDLSSLSALRITSATKEAPPVNRTTNGASSVNALPADFPPITVDTSDNPSSGEIFLANNSLTPASDNYGNYIMILNNDGSVVRYMKVPAGAYDFKVQPNGDISYGELTKVVMIGSSDVMEYARWIVMDTSFTPIDTFECGNGYGPETDVHDFVLLPNGHALLFASDPEPVNMSQYGGSANAVVIGNIVQELDASKDVVFQWRTWDAIPDTDSYMSLTTNTVDLTHGNALDVDRDGNIIFSMRHLSSIVKIDRQTGNIDWILGGKQNQFTFENEHASNAPTYFSFQHDARILPNGDLTLFDNGNQHNPPYSRAVEYKLDEQDKTANLVWEYRHNPDIFNFAMGSVQRLANGNSLIGWGFASANGAPALTEVRPDGSIALEISLPAGQYSYRAYKFPWVSQTPVANVSVGATTELLQGDTYSFNDATDTTGVSVKFNQLSALYATASVSRYDYAPLNPTFSGTAPIMSSNYFNFAAEGIGSYSAEVQVNLKYYPDVTNPSQTVVYARNGSSGNFIPLPTSYDSSKDQLTFNASTFGDFAFGIPQTVDSVYAPVPIAPADSEAVFQEAPVTLVWGTRGVVKTYELQVATDPSFSNPIVDNSNLGTTSYTMTNLDSTKTYYWRVDNTNAAGTSKWSTMETFSPAPDFIKILSPRGGDALYLDSTYVISWKSDVKDTVRIELLRGNILVTVIADSLYAGTDAIDWQVPTNLQEDSTYRISVVSINNSNLTGANRLGFSILEGITSVNQTPDLPEAYRLEQNYPDPFNPTTQISYSVASRSQVTLEIFNELGQKISTLYSGIRAAGDYTATFDASRFASGVYFYRLTASPLSGQGRSFYSVKKMVFVK